MMLIYTDNIYIVLDIASYHKRRHAQKMLRFVDSDHTNSKSREKYRL